MKKHIFNILTFTHPKEELTFYFSDKEQPGLIRVYHKLVPDEVVDAFGEQEHFYTMFETHREEFIPVTKRTKPLTETIVNEDGEEKKSTVRNAAFTSSVLKRYYNAQIHKYFSSQGLMVKPNFISDTEVWLLSAKQPTGSIYDFYDRYVLKVQFKTVTDSPELLVTFEGKSRVFKASVKELLEDVAPADFNWVIFNNGIYKFDELPEAGRRQYDAVYPVWNFDIRDALRQATEAPDRSNKYKNFKEAIDFFEKTYLNTDGFKTIIPLSSQGFVPVPELKLGAVKKASNSLLFGSEKEGIIPYNGIKDNGPFELSPSSKIEFFYILHQDDKAAGIKVHEYLGGKLSGFKGLEGFIHTPYYANKDSAIVFENRDNPWPEVYRAIIDRTFKSDIQYIAIYISPIAKNVTDRQQKGVYYQIKELLLKKGIPSQVIEADKVLTNEAYYFSLPNISIAILAKLNGIPWRLNTKPKDELVVGIGAFRSVETEVSYIGSAFSFANTGKFNRFECFKQHQIKELAGSILRAVKEYANLNTHIKRLVIHFYKSMSKEELQPIEDGLKKLGLDIPVFIISINKTESSDIVAFDSSWSGLMPLSGTFINIGFNKFLLFNNTRYSTSEYKAREGFPFPIKLKIYCTEPELAKDYTTVRELIDQVYQFSRIYWKSVSQQNLPVTIKYPEMVAEMFPHFDGNEIPEFGKDNLWFL